MIKKSLISLMYEAASIQRWNDHIRPWTGFTELDKQAHKMQMCIRDRYTAVRLRILKQEIKNIWIYLNV